MKKIKIFIYSQSKYIPLINKSVQKIKNENVQFYLILDSRLKKDNFINLSKKIKIATNKEISKVLISKSDLAISFLYNKILTKKIIDKFHSNIFNIHPSYLPLNRGSNPYTWAILNETRHGVTIHYLDEKIDHGPIVYQREIKINRLLTAEQLRQVTLPILQETLILLIRNWLHNKPMNEIKSKNTKKVNTQKEFNKQRILIMSKKSKEYDIIKNLRAYSIGPNGGLDVFYNGEKYRIRIEVEN